MLWLYREKKKAQYETAINFLFSKREVDDNQIRTKKGWKEFAQFSTFPWKQSCVISMKQYLRTPFFLRNIMK